MKKSMKEDDNCYEEKQQDRGTARAMWSDGCGREALLRKQHFNEGLESHHISGVRAFEVEGTVNLRQEMVRVDGRAVKSKKYW